MKIKRIAIILLCVLLTLQSAGCTGNVAEKNSAEADTSEISISETSVTETASSEPENFHYIHDPRDNPKAMKDIIKNPDAIYGFSPNPESERLGSYAELDWSDPKIVAARREERIAYHESIDTLYDMLLEMRDEGKSIEDMARAVSAERNRLRLASYVNDPEGLETVKKSNLEKYGHEDGPTADELYEEYGSWETVIQKAFSTNPGMDACLGLYDDYYDFYEEVGMAQ